MFQRSHHNSIEPYSTPPFISVGVEISPSTETLNYLFEWKDIFSLIKLVVNAIL
jgi:hypothetical protein